MEADYLAARKPVMNLQIETKKSESSHEKSPYPETHTPISFDDGLSLSDMERIVILETLRRHNNNRTQAARVLGIGIRTLQRKLKNYNQPLRRL
jgi:transcriptional regulator with PAS, ATPase and Fis domain